MFKLYCIVPFVVVALTLIDPFVKLHPFGSTLLPVVIVIALVFSEITSDALIVHPLYVPVTTYVHAVFAAVLAVLVPFDHTYDVAPFAVSVTPAVVHDKVFVFGLLLIVNSGVNVYIVLVCTH